MNIDNILKVVRGIVRIRGNSDNTLIGNTGTRLHVETQDGAPSDAPGCPTFSTKYRSILDNTTHALTTTISNIFTYNGSGKFIGFIFSCDKATIKVDLKIDGEYIFQNILLSDVALLDFKAQTSKLLEATGDGKRLKFVPICPIAYTSSVVIDAKTSIGTANILNSQFALTKET